MSYVIYPATVIADTTPIIIHPTQQVANCGMIEILNDSSFGLSGVIPGNSGVWVLPQSGVFLASEDYYGEDIKLFPMLVMSGNFSGLPQQLTIIGFDKGEQSPPAGTVIDLSKIVVVANSIPVQTNVNNIQNDGNPAGTMMVESTVAGDSSSAVRLTNDGKLSIGNATHPGQVSFDNGLVTTDGAGDFTAKTLEGGSALISNGIIAKTYTTTPQGGYIDSVNAGSPFRVGSSSANPGDLIDATGGDFYLKSSSNSGDTLRWQSPNGTDKFTVKVHGGTVSSCGSGTTISHGMGVTPTTLVCNPVIAQPGSATVGAANYNSSTFRATIGAGSTLIWYGITF